MTYKEKAMLLESARRIDALEQKLAAAIRLIDALDQRRRGRPSAEETRRLSEMRDEIHG